MQRSCLNPRGTTVITHLYRRRAHIIWNSGTYKRKKYDSVLLQEKNRCIYIYIYIVFLQSFWWAKSNLHGPFHVLSLSVGPPYVCVFDIFISVAGCVIVRLILALTCQIFPPINEKLAKFRQSTLPHL